MLQKARFTAIAIAAAISLAVANSAVAQFDTGGTALALTINGFTPDVVSPAAHTVAVDQGSTMTIALNGTSIGIPFILIGGASPLAGAISIPSVGTVDLDSPFVILDGLVGGTPFDLMARSNFSVTLPTAPPPALVGAAAPAFQAIYLEPANPPFNLELTQAGQPVYTGMRTTVYSGLGDDVTQLHALSLVPNVTFGGIARTQLLIGSNGMITFTTGSTDFSPSTGEFHNGFRTAGTAGSNPGLAPLWGDWFLPSFVGDNVTVQENGITNTVTVAWNNQVWYATSLPAGSWSVELGTFGPNSFVFDLTGALPGGATDVAPITGVTDGSDITGPNNTIDFGTALPYSSAPGLPDSVCEQFSAGGIGANPYNLGIVSYVDALGTFEWTIF